MIVSGGENVFPAEVEDCISGHPDVVEATAIGVEDKEWGHRLRAFVVKKDNTDLDEDTVKKHVRDQLAKYKVPREVIFLDELPRNPTGKILKRELREIDADYTVESCCAVELFAQDVELSGVPGGLLDHVHVDPAQRDRRRNDDAAPRDRADNARRSAGIRRIGVWYSVSSVDSDSSGRNANSHERSCARRLLSLRSCRSCSNQPYSAQRKCLSSPPTDVPDCDEWAAGIGIGKTGNLAHHNVSVVVEECLQRGTLAFRLVFTTIGTLCFWHDREASTAGLPGDQRPFADAPGYFGGQLRVGQQQVDECGDDLLPGHTGESEPVGGLSLPDVESPVGGRGQVDGAPYALASRRLPGLVIDALPNAGEAFGLRRGVGAGGRCGPERRRA